MLASQPQQQLVVMETCACRHGFLLLCLAASHTMKFPLLGSSHAVDHHRTKRNSTKWTILLFSSLLCHSCYFLWLSHFILVTSGTSQFSCPSSSLCPQELVHHPVSYAFMHSSDLWAGDPSSFAHGWHSLPSEQKPHHHKVSVPQPWHDFYSLHLRS